jgi:hypothetical protein
MLMGMFIIPKWMCLLTRVHLGVRISAWASALLVQQWWAMRRPQSVGRVTVQIPALFLFNTVQIRPLPGI